MCFVCVLGGQGCVCVFSSKEYDSHLYPVPWAWLQRKIALGWLLVRQNLVVHPMQISVRVDTLPPTSMTF